jgi:hypothetical protein
LTAQACAGNTKPTRNASTSSQLRSAFLGPNQWGVQKLSVDEINRQLERHFEVVVQELKRHTETSLDQAMALAESMSALVWTDSERSQLRSQLAARRRWQIQTLEAYAARGRFPQNEGYANRPVPIFVDRHGTRCAVGYLMHRSGWDPEVASVAQQDNLIEVPNVRDGVLIDWILQSGLTQEEAALIQPAYMPPEFQATLSDFQVPGTTVSLYGLTVSDFDVKELSYDDFGGGVDFAFDFGRAMIDAAGIDYSDPDNVGLAIGEGTYESTPGGPHWTNNLEQWVFVGGREVGLGQPNINDNSIMFKLEYSIQVETGYTDEFALTSSANFNFNFLKNFETGAIKVLTEITDLNGRFISAGSIATDESGFGFLDDTVFMAVDDDQYTVTTYALAYEGATFTSLFHEFRSIPEPTSAGLLLGLCGIALIVRGRRTER